MDEVIVIEVLEPRAGRVRERVKSTSRRVAIGRGYDNDVVIDDPYVSVEHLRLERQEAGHLVLRDVGSENGTFTVRPRRRIAEVVLDGDNVFRVGRTLVRIRTEGYTPAAALREHRGVGRLAERPALGVTLAVLAVGVTLLELFLATYAAAERRFVIPVVLAAGLAAAIWVGAWAAITRLVLHTPRWWAHVSLTAAGMLGLLALDVVIAYSVFALSIDTWQDILDYIGLASVAVVVLYGHLRLATHRVRWQAALIALVLTGGGVGLIFSLGHALEANFETGDELRAELRPLGPGLTRRGSLDELLARTDRLRAIVDRLASR